MRPLGLARHRALLAACAAAILSCVDAPTAPRSRAVVTATPEALSLFPLDTALLGAEVRTPDGRLLAGAALQWRSLDTSVVLVSVDGRVSAPAYAGAAVRRTGIIVTAPQAGTDTVPVEVLPWAVARVALDSSALTLAVGESRSLTATLEAANGRVLTDRPVAWIADDTAVVRVSATGVVTARPYAGPAERSTRVVVFGGGLADTAIVTVRPVTPATLQLAPTNLTVLPGAVDSVVAVVRSATGDTLRDFPIAWQSTDTTVVRVNAAGVVTASFYVGAAMRAAAVVAALGPLADTVAVDVPPLPVAAVSIADGPREVQPGRTLQLDATLTSADGLFLTDRPATWTSSDTSVAVVDSTGFVTAAALGDADARTVLIIAANGGVADSVTLTLPPLAVAWVTATPEALSLRPQDTVTVAVALQSLDLITLSGRSVTWASLDTTVARVDVQGRVTAAAYTGAAVRNTQLIVTSGVAADTVPVEVLPLPVARVVVTPSAVTLSPGDSTSLVVAPQAPDGTVLSGHDVLWLSSDTAVVTVDQAGRIRARPYFGALERNAQVVVFASGLADTADITIQPLSPQEVRLDADTLALTPGMLDSLVATLLSAAGDTLTGAALGWTSSDTTVVRVNADGVVTAVFYVGPDERAATVTVTAGALRDSVLLRVLPLAVASVAVFPDTQTLQPEQTLQLDAVLRDSAGLFLTGRAVQWTSSDTLRATVSDSGLVSARVAGDVTITAESGGVMATATLTIVPVVTSVQVTPGLSTVWIGRSQQFAAALRDTNGTAPSGRRVTWQTSDPAVATVDSLGLVRAVAPGLVAVIATSEGRADSALVDVFAEPDAAVTITFDDSWRGVLTEAFPVLQELRLRANIGWITSVDWSNVMVPEELRQLQDAGWSILSHSMTHPYLTTLSPDSAAAELAGSRARVASLGFDPRVFIVPYLNHDDDVLLASAAAGYRYTRCCAQDYWSTDTLVDWPIQESVRHRLTGVDVTNYEGQTTSYNFRTAQGRAQLRTLLLDVVANGKFVDVFFHDILPEDVPDLRLTLEILAEFRPYLITYGMLPD